MTLRWIKPVVFLAILIAMWDLAVRTFHIPPHQLPSPYDVIATLYQEWPNLLAEAWPTTLATLAGFALSALLGIPTAMLIAGSKTVEDCVHPLLVFWRSMPQIAIAPLFVVWFGFGLLPKVLCAFLLGVFPVVVSSVQGFKSVEPDMVDLVRALQGSQLQVFRIVSLPHALPAIFAGLKVSITLAMVGAVACEFVGANSGIGFVLQRSVGAFALPLMFAALVVVALIGAMLFWLIDLAGRLLICVAPASGGAARDVE